MRTFRRFPIAVAVALPLCLAASWTSQASCGSSKRISHGSAECLNAGWENRTLSWSRKRSTFWAESKCPGWGKVVAKIDISGGSDNTWTLTNDNRRSGNRNYHVRNISCCTDLSDLCKKSDVLTPAGCISQFEDSPAVRGGTCLKVGYNSGSGYHVSASDDRAPSATVSGENCTITASCAFASNYTRTTVTVPYTNADDLVKCFTNLC